MELEHIGIAVVDLDNSIRIYESLLKKEPRMRERISSEMVEVAVFDVNPKIELLRGTNPDSPISRFMEDKKRDTIHHIAFRINDLQSRLEELKNTGYKIIEGYPKEGKNKSKVAFLHPKSTGGTLIELVEER